MGGEHAPPHAKYSADGTGRDTYIRRDPVECFGKTLYKSEPRIPTRFGVCPPPSTAALARRPSSVALRAPQARLALR